MSEHSLSRVKDNLKELKMHRILEILNEEVARAGQEKSGYVTLLDRLFSEEARVRRERKIERYISQSKIPERKTLEEFDFDFQPKLDKDQIMDLARLEFVKRKENVLLVGRNGLGKSHLVKAIGLKACIECYRVYYTTSANLMIDLFASLADNTLTRRLRRYFRPDLLIIDEVGFDRLEHEQTRNANLLFKVIDGRYQRGSVMLTSNIEFKAWGDYLGDQLVATAILDRLLHHGHLINYDGKSFRINEFEKRMQAKKKKQKK